MTAKSYRIEFKPGTAHMHDAMIQLSGYAAWPYPEKNETPRVAPTVEIGMEYGKDRWVMTVKAKSTDERKMDYLKTCVEGVSHSHDGVFSETTQDRTP